MIYFNTFDIAHEDAVNGYSKGKSARKNQDRGLLVPPKMFHQHLPVDPEIIKRELGDHERKKYCIPLFVNLINN